MIKQRLMISAFLVCLAVPASAQLFGPSDEETARENAQDSGIKDLQSATQQQDVRIKALEDKVRGLTDSLAQATGTNEELSHQIQLQNEKIDRMQKDFAYRLCSLSAQQLGAGDAMNCAAAGTASASAPSASLAGAPASQPPQALHPGQSLPPIGSSTIDATGNGGPASSSSDEGPAVRGRPPGVLGTLPMGSGPMGSGPMASGPAPAPASAVGPAVVNSGQYDQAMNLMRRAQYDEASAAFRSYADANPDDSQLAPQAIYWVANIAFIRQDYATAAHTFAEVIKKYPKSQPASEAMLKLAQSFMGMGQKSEGCTTLGLIKTKYPNASPQTLTQAASLRKTACK